ncbi:MAG: TIGR03088 family PEP-CTERM/XrtA system glycosyltransferase [Gammaproteobacteria bacterium]|nr:TIGR03088 family PEP-CTERM/XrtA system glycosyltransferase [Gammaproteobacteria bacterium]
MNSHRPLIAHVVFALRVGGLENGVVNLINRIPQDRFRHVIICITDYSDFSRRIRRDDVEIHALHKQAGKDPGWYLRLWRLLRQLRPDIVHTRNLATLEAQFIAFLAGVPGRVHGEHGWDMYDLGGANRKYRLLRRIIRPFVQRFIPLSAELHHYLSSHIGVPDSKITRICNGVDTERFRCQRGERKFPFAPVDTQDILIGSVGRMELVKDPLNLVDAFVYLVDRSPALRERVRLVMIGGGSLYDKAVARLRERGLSDRVWLPGHRDDIADILRILDIFVLPSRAEGISNTILEAMASCLPVVATRVGGNSDLVEDGRNAILVKAADSIMLAEALSRYIMDPVLRREHGKHSRARVESLFSIHGMVEKYMAVYDALSHHGKASAY